MNPNSQSNIRVDRIDHISLSRNLLILVGVFGTVLLAFFAIKSGNPMFMVGLVALPFLLMLMYRPDIAFVMAMMMDATGMPIPGVSYTTLGLIAKVVVIGAACLAFFLGQKRFRRKRMAEDRPLKWFAAITIMLMAVRGSGIRMLGSSTWGGMIYVNIFAGIAFYFAIQGLTISKKQIRWVLWGSALCGLLGALSALQGWATEVEGETSVGASRLSWLRPLVWAFLPLVFAIKWKKWVSALLWLAVVGAIAATGFRSQLVAVMAITGIYGFFRAKNKPAYMIGSALVAVALWGAVVVSSPFMPKGIQRAISFVPGAAIDQRMMTDAEGSIDWRVEIWEYCLSQSKQYLLIGRGSAFDVRETSASVTTSDIATYTPWFAYETRSYHSGPLTLLIDYGLPGLIVALWLTFAVMRRFWRAATEFRGANTLEERFALISIANLLWFWPAFYLVFGSAPGFAKLIASTAAVVVIVNSVRKLKETERLQDEGQITDDGEVDIPLSAPGGSSGAIR